MKILVADDSPVFREVLKAMLKQWGYEVITAYGGEEAWRVLQAHDAPRLVILDWMMPDLDGLEVCRRIRQSGRSVYILILTAKTEAQDLTTALEGGADDYITKPLKSAELRLRLRAGQHSLEADDLLLSAAPVDIPFPGWVA